MQISILLFWDNLRKLDVIDFVLFYFHICIKRKAMLIEYNFAEDLLEEIDDQLDQYQEDNEIKFSNSSPTSKRTNFESLIKLNEFSFPVFTRSSSNQIIIARYFFEIEAARWEKEKSEFVEQGKEKAIEKLINSEFFSYRETIFIAIQTKISNLINEYSRVFEATKETNFLFGIEDEEKILVNHQNKYMKVLNSNDQQMQIIEGIWLNKEISDLVTKIYLRFISLRLKLLNPVPVEFEEAPKQNLAKIIWNGDQRDLLELFVELEYKGWIEEPKPGDRNKTAKAICNLFDLSLTKRTKENRVVESFYQIYKGDLNGVTKKREYDAVLKSIHKRSFCEIRENSKV